MRKFIPGTLRKTLLSGKTASLRNDNSRNMVDFADSNWKKVSLEIVRWDQRLNFVSWTLPHPVSISQKTEDGKCRKKNKVNLKRGQQQCGQTGARDGGPGGTSYIPALKTLLCSPREQEEKLLKVTEWMMTRFWLCYFMSSLCTEDRLKGRAKRWTGLGGCQEQGESCRWNEGGAAKKGGEHTQESGWKMIQWMSLQTGMQRGLRSYSGKGEHVFKVRFWTPVMRSIGTVWAETLMMAQRTENQEVRYLRT